ncbi:hypothetical protein VEE15_43780 [Escherichia coli]|nr:hypothetical protein VEE15_43780 [Escherichia coli]
MSIVVKNNIHWVGQRDWEVRDFHGTEYKTLRGSSYNSYLIREEKNVLIDTVDHKFSREFVQNLRNEIDLADIDYIVINHAEEDHAGALTELMAQIPDTPIYCTANAIDSINGHHHHPEWNFNVVKTGDTLRYRQRQTAHFCRNTNAALAGQHDDLPDRRRGAVQ